MRRFIGYVSMAIIGTALTAACAVDTEKERETGSVESGLGVERGDGAQTTLGTDLASVDLSRPDVALRFDAEWATDDARVRLTNGKGPSILLSELVQTAEKTAGFSTPKGGFVLRSASSKLSWPGGGKCSIHTQTDCCECGWWVNSGTTALSHFPPFCAGFWCPVVDPY